MEDNKDVMKMLEYLEEIKNAVRNGQVDALLISACGDDEAFFHASGSEVTLFGLNELQYKQLNKECESKKQKRGIAKMLTKIADSND